MLNNDNANRVLGLLRSSPHFNLASRVGSANVIFQEAGLGVFHRFYIDNPGTSGATILYSSLDAAIDDEYDLSYFWGQYSAIIKSGVGSRDIISLPNFVDYMQKITELMGVIHSLLGLKALYNCDWKTLYGEERPRELSILGENLDLPDAAFSARFSDVLRAAQQFAAPAPLVNLSALLHSPFSPMSANRAYMFTSMLDATLSSSGAAAFKTAISNLVTLLADTPIYATVRDTLHNTMLGVPVIGSPTVLNDTQALLHVNALMNAKYGSTHVDGLGGYTNDSPYETQLRFVSDNTSGFDYLAGNVVNGNVNLFGYSTVAYAGLGTDETFHYRLSATGSPDIDDSLLCPFYVTDPDALVVTGARTCYNLGLVNYDRYATIDSVGQTLILPNMAYYRITTNTKMPLTDVDAAAAFDLFEDDEFLSHRTVNEAFTAIGDNVTVQNIKEPPRPEFAQRYSTKIEAVRGVLFDEVLGQIARTTGMPELFGLTKLSGVRTARPEVNDAANNNKRR